MSVIDPLFGDVVKKLKASVQQGRTIDAAQVQIVGLEDIRKAAGEDWPAIKERVRANSLSFLQGCLTSEDIVIPCGDGFLVIFNEGDARDLKKECQALRASLNAFYLGDANTKGLSTHVRQQKLDADGVAEIVSAAQPPANENGEASIGWEADLSNPEFQLKHEIVLAPMWSVAQEVVSTYMATPEYCDGPVYRFGYDPNYRTEGRHGGVDYAAVDLQIADFALKALARSLSEGRRCLIGFSVHASTMQNRAARQAVLERLAAAPLHVRKYLMARIAEVEPGTPLVTLSDWVGLLRTITPRVCIELHPSERSLHGLGATGAFSVGFFLPMTGPLRADVRQRCAALIARWVNTLHRQDVKLFVDNIKDYVLFERACELGADYMTSESVWPVPPAPEGVTAFPRASVRAAFHDALSA